MSRAPSKPVQMALLHIGYTSVLLPADKAMKVAEAMQHAVSAEVNFEGHTEVCTVKDQPLRVEFALVRANQIRMPQGEPFSMPTMRPALPSVRPRLAR